MFFKNLTFERLLFLLITLTLSIAVVILLLKGCRQDKHECPPCEQILQPSQNIIQQGRDSVVRVPVPYRVDVPGPVVYIPQEQPAELIPAKDYYQPPTPCDSISSYRDTFKLGDKGFSVVEQSVRGRILSQSHSFSLTTPVYTQKQPKPKPAVFIGLQAMYSVDSLRYGFTGVSLDYLPKNQKNIYSLGIGRFNRETMVTGKISFRIGKP